MKKLLIVAALTLASLFGGLSAAGAAGIDVCYEVNINGNAQAACHNVPLPV